MSKTYNIPLKHEAGVYGLQDLKKSTEDAIELQYSEYGEIVTYKLPNCESRNEIRMYSIPKKLLETTLKATYNHTGHLKRITVHVKDKDMLLYIHYENMEEAKKEIEKFALENANDIIAKISMCKDVVSRLFLEYFNDGEYIDFHAKIGTEAQKIALEKKYTEYEDIADSCGDYDSEMIEGDNDRLKIMISCANKEEFNYFRFAVDIMTQIIQEKAVEKLNKADDFKFLCMEYD